MQNLSFLQFNPQSASTSDRLADIAAQVPIMDFASLTGTGGKRYGEAVVWRKAGDRWMVEAGWQRGPFANKSAGCGILLGKRIARRSVTNVWSAPSTLPGRGLAIRARARHYDVAVISLYFPPVPNYSAQMTAYYKTCDALSSWVRKLPIWSSHRCVPVLCADVNSGFGLQRSPGTDEWTRIKDPFIRSAAPLC